jgi:hypothetical protein
MRMREREGIGGADKEPGERAYPAMTAIEIRLARHVITMISMENARSLMKIDAPLIFYCIRKELWRV